MRKDDTIDAIIHNKPESAKNYKKITEKQWTVYYYLLSVSIYNHKDREDHRYVYKSSINISSVSKNLGIARSTFYTAIETLGKFDLVESYSDYYILKLPKSYAEISRKLLSQLLSYRKELTVDLLRTYLFFAAAHRLIDGKEFTMRNLIRCLGYPDNVPDYYKKVEIYIDLLRSWGLIQFSTRVENTELGQIRVYRIEKVFGSSTELDSRFSFENEMCVKNIGLSEEEENRIQSALS